MSLTISREQRDAIHHLLVERLTGIGDIWIELEKHQLTTAKRLAREYIEELHLLTDIGWDETVAADTVTLTRPVGELVRILLRLHKRLAGHGRPRARPNRPRDALAGGRPLGPAAQSGVRGRGLAWPPDAA